MGNEKGFVQLEPDLVGEHHVALTSDVKLVNGCLSAIANSGNEVLTSEKFSAVLTVLNRATRGEHGPASANAVELLEAIVRTLSEQLASIIVPIALNSPGRLSDILTNAVDTMTDQQLEAIEACLPDWSFGLAECALKVTRKRLKNTPNLAAFRKRLNDMVAGYTSLGDIAAATVAAEGAVEISRLEHRKDPTAYTEQLASDLATLANRHLKAKEHEKAERAIEEAVALIDSENGHGRELNSTVLDVLHTYGRVLSKMERHVDALEVLDRAIKLLVEGAPKGGQRVTAATGVFFVERANTLQKLGRYAESREYIARALSAVEPIAGDNSEQAIMLYVEVLSESSETSLALNDPGPAHTLSAQALRIILPIALRTRFDITDDIYKLYNTHLDARKQLFVETADPFCEPVKKIFLRQIERRGDAQDEKGPRSSLNASVDEVYDFLRVENGKRTARAPTEPISIDAITDELLEADGPDAFGPHKQKMSRLYVGPTHVSSNRTRDS